MKLKFFEIETGVKSKLNQKFAPHNQRRCRKEPVLVFRDACIELKEEQDVSTQFFQRQNKHFNTFQDHLEKYCNVVPVFGLNSAKYDKISIKSYLLPLLVN